MPSPDAFAFNIFGKSILNEDAPGLIGPDITFECKDPDGCQEMVLTVVIRDFPPGSDVSYMDMSGATVSWTDVPSDFVLTITGNTQAELEMQLATLRVTPPENSDEDFSLTITLMDDAGRGMDRATYIHQVQVTSTADPPAVKADDIRCQVA